MFAVRERKAEMFSIQRISDQDGDMSSESIEIERKYAAPAEAAIPAAALRDLPGVARVRRKRPVEMQAQYFDTSDLGLAGAKVTLRKRSGGLDEGWHLKLPEAGYRREIHSPLTDSDEIPEELAVRLHTLLRGRALVPAVVLHTRRTVHELLGEKDQVLAEICDDQVSSTPGLKGAEAAEWREWEVELRAADAALFDLVEPLLLERGATTGAGPSKLARSLGDLVPAPAAELPGVGDKATVGEVARDYLAGEIARLMEHDAGTRQHAADAIHQMRVAARRLRSVLSSYREIVGQERSEQLRDELKALADSLGDARDSEVMLERLRGRLDEQPEDRVRGPIRERIDAALTERYEKAHEKAMKFMSSRRYYKLLDALDELVIDWQAGGDADKKAKKALAEVFAGDWKRLRKRAHAADAIDDPIEHEEALHDVRKSAKRLRYGMDSATGVLGKQAKQVAKASAAVTELLGDHNDSVITSRVIGELAEEAFARGEDTFTYGRMQQAEESHASVSRGALAELLDELNELRLPGWKKI